MKNLLIAVILFVVFVPFTAGAFTVPEEVQVTTPPTVATEVAPAPAPAPANNKTYKAIKSLDRRLVGKKGMVTLIKEKVQNLYSEITATKTAATDAQTKAEAAMTSAIDAKNAVTALDKKLTDKNTGEFKKMKDTAWSVGNELSKDMTKMTLWIIGTCLVLVILIIIIIIRRTRAANVNLQPIEDTVNNRSDEILAAVQEVKAQVAQSEGRIVDEVKATKAYNESPIDVTVAGLHAILTLSDEAKGLGVYEYIDVEKGIDPGFKPEDYPLPTSSDRNFAFDKTRQAIRQYGNGSLKRMADGGDSIAAAKILLIEYHRDVTKQLVVAPV